MSNKAIWLGDWKQYIFSHFLMVLVWRKGSVPMAFIGHPRLGIQWMFLKSKLTAARKQLIRPNWEISHLHFTLSWLITRNALIIHKSVSVLKLRCNSKGMVFWKGGLQKIWLKNWGSGGRCNNEWWNKMNRSWGRTRPASTGKQKTL